MSEYHPPINDMLFVINHMLDNSSLPQMQNGELDSEMIEAVLNEAGKLASDVLAPINHTGDQSGCQLEDGKVSTPEGFREAYAKFIENGWNAVPFEPEYGGQGLPWLLTFSLQEMWQSANMAFGLCPLLTQAGVEALQAYGTKEQKDTYLEKLITGEWTGTMQLTEPQAGTDLGQLRCKAEPQDDGSFKLYGQKIYITYGEHDFTDNIIHMVLARTPDAPPGYKGISMFLVPKILPDGSRNDAYAVGLEHKLGIHASPTCTMQYGDNEGATGWLIGKENEGLKNMFIMMNNARLCVGLQGVALAERAYQKALSYAKDRVQSARIDDKSAGSVRIIEHPDVKRMLMNMKCRTEAARALAYDAGLALDLAKNGDQAAAKKADLLTPIVKAFSTDMANEVTALGVQVHGGMGFIEETGAAQYVRDARILSIYEGTNGVQSQDLYVQKLLKDKAKAANDYFIEIETAIENAQTHNELGAFQDHLKNALNNLRLATDKMLQASLVDGAAVSVPYLRLFGTVACGYMSLRAAQTCVSAANDIHDELFCKNKIEAAHFYCTHILSAHESLKNIVIEGSEAVSNLKEDSF